MSGHRKISQNARRALYAREIRRLGNTCTHWDGVSFVLELHGNPIARLTGTEQGDKLEIRTAGWPTVTTKERLNALPGVDVYTHKGVLHLNGKPWDNDHDWTVVS